MKKDNKLIKLSEAVELLNVHPNTLRKWDKDGLLKAIRFGKRGDRRYHKNDLIDFIKNKKI